ncbi:hypothetical protein CABS01_04864 [Colletotrichum abscissum]|uniref:uncharacterized protein n=1 Tax=Colletotrichum abscissum TaxID=1671311 RepID=UPI0027D65CDD|nr:uncharacterized protein CABS01_04864 [Colletotrichum abscissum]KAK1472221.1 hypothetical protein CABS01_04864 [Colletotrichum abscissum]
MLPRCRHFRLPSLWHLAVEHGSGNLDHRLSGPRETERPGHRPKIGLPCGEAKPDRLLESIPIALCRRLPISEAALRRRASRVGQVGRFQNMAGRKTGRKAKKRHEKIRGKAT